MSAQEAGVRAGQTRALTVAVTGAATPVGSALCARLASRPDVGTVLAVDARRADLPGVTWRVVDLRDPVLQRRLSGVDVVVHVAVDASPDTEHAARRAFNVGGARNVLKTAAAAGVRKVVLLSSATVYGALPDNPVPLDEDAPLRATADESLVGDLLKIERIAARARKAPPGTDVVVVRPAPLVGPGVDTSVTRYFEAPRLLVLKEGRPHWQLCHVDDLVRALEVVVTRDVRGPVTVGCEGWLDQREVEELAGRRRLELPSSLAFATAERLHRLGVTPAPASELTQVMHPWVVPSTRLRAAGWRPAYDNRTALQALLAETAGRTAIASRRVGRQDALAPLGAAGATAAVLATAAIVRRSRRRRFG